MATLNFADRVKETTATTGTGAYSLDGAASGFQGFVAGIGSGNVCPYCCTNGADWEVGRGTVTDGTPDTLSRDVILASSNGGAAVNWGAGSKELFCTVPADSVNDSMVRAWVNFNGTGTPAIRDSCNVSSITDHGTGDFTLNFTVPMPSTNYVVVGVGSIGDGTSGTMSIDVYTRATTSVRVRTKFGSSATLFDYAYSQFVVIGG
jgi:hypothetical protein